MLYLPKDNSSVHNSPHTPWPSRPLFTAQEECQDHARHNRVRSFSPSTSDYEEDHWTDVRPGFKDRRDTVKQRNRSDHELPLGSHSGQNHRTSANQNGMTRPVLNGWSNVVQLIKNDLSEQGYLRYSCDDKLFEPVYELETILSRRHQATEQPEKILTRHSSMRVGHSRAWQEECVGRRSDGRLVRRLNSSKSRSGDGQRHVRFQDDDQWNNVNSDRQRTSEGRHESIQAGRNVQIGRPGSLHEVSRTYSTGDFQQASRVRSFPLQKEQGPCRFRERGGWEGHSCRVQRESRESAHSCRDEWRREGRESRQYRGEHGRRHGRRQGYPEERSSSEDEEEERERVWRREERQDPRPSNCSLSVSGKGNSPKAGIVRDRTCLDLGELEQVLRDEELAHRLQELEEKIHRQNSSLATPSQTQYPAGDFRVAQVAQDEEIARFIQKEELEAQMRSGQLEHCGPVRGYREMSHVYDHNGVYDRQMQRERLDSEGFVSPGYESSPERQPSSHTTIAVQPQQHTRNVVEDLDPTFPRNDSGPAEQDTGGTLQMQSTSQTASNLEPAFVTPTKRHLPKSLRIKSKEKKESTKRKGSCKQQ
ncbi:coiled-coil domain-containing protein 187 isoform X1 [Trichomycterus rosablanca]|uniref:coiled-coil domain-containing protein 187 isoform X1 n=1 Tax=Trichomycterus rosablanca TaxID=2290929 RepID=UPI002F35C120